MDGWMSTPRLAGLVEVVFWVQSKDEAFLGAATTRLEPEFASESGSWGAARSGQSKVCREATTAVCLKAGTPWLQGCQGGWFLFQEGSWWGPGAQMPVPAERTPTLRSPNRALLDESSCFNM